MPFRSWDEPNTTQAEVDKKGYCTHANYLFPPWHRPYLLLYEACFALLYLATSRLFCFFLTELYSFSNESMRS